MKISKLFILLILSSGLSILATIAGLEVFQRRILQKAQAALAEHRQMAAQVRPKLVLGLGDSHMAYGPDLPEEIFFNLSFQGECYLRSFLKLREHFKKRWRPQYLLLVFDPLAFSGSLFGGVVFNSYHNYTHLFEPKDFALIHQAIPDFRQRLESSDFLINRQKANAFGRLKNMLMDRLGFRQFEIAYMKQVIHLFWEEMLDSSNIPRFGTNGTSHRPDRAFSSEIADEGQYLAAFLFKNSLENSQVGNLFSTYFKEILKLAKAENVEVILFHAPIHRKQRERIPPDFYRYFHDLKKMAQTEYGARYWDFSDLIKEDKYFYDRDHVTSQGQKILSQAILQRMEKELGIKAASPVKIGSRERAPQW